MMLRRTLAMLCIAAVLCAPARAQTPPNVPTINGSVTITTGNTFQQLLPAVTFLGSRKSLTIQNNNATDNCWIAFGSAGGAAITAGNATKAESILLMPGGSFQRYQPYIPSDAIIGTCATAGDTIYIDTQ